MTKVFSQQSFDNANAIKLFFVRAWAPWTVSISLCCILSALLGIIEVCLKSEQWWLIVQNCEGSDAVQIVYFFHGNSCTWHNENVVHDLRVVVRICIRNVCILNSNLSYQNSKNIYATGTRGFPKQNRKVSLCVVQGTVQCPFVLLCCRQGCLPSMQWSSSCPWSLFSPEHAQISEVRWAGPRCLGIDAEARKLYILSQQNLHSPPQWCRKHLASFPLDSFHQKGLL